MPLFTFHCEACGAEQELLVRGGEQPACGACASTRLQKQLARITPMTGGATPAPMEGCGAAQCCQMNGGCMN